MKGERNSRVVPPFPETPRCLSPFQGNLFSLHCLHFQAEHRLTPRWHVGQPCGKASWESLVGKPRGIATDPLIHGKGSVNLLLQLGRKAHVHAPTRDDERLPWGDSRSSPRSMSAMERNSQVPAPMPHKVLSQGDTAATAREESARAGPHSRRVLTPLGRLRSTPRSMSALERNPQVLAPTPHKVLGPGIDGRGIPRGPRATRMGTGLS